MTAAERAYKAKYRRAHRQEANELSRRWYQENREYARRVRKEWRDRNPDMVREHARAHVAVRRSGGTDRIGASERRLIPLRTICSYCGASDASGFDHVIPLSRGGTNTIDNVVPCCFLCNSSKGATSMIVFILRRRV